MGSELETKNRKSTKIFGAISWSFTGEIAAKIVTPITNMILARILAPEAFGVVATVTMVISFADMFSDSGFQKFLIQHEFQNEETLKNSTNVAFTSNFIVSLLLWAIISIFRDPIATLVGNPGLGIVISVAGLSLPLTSFSSIQSAIFKRKMEFKTLCIARVIVACIPLVITVPLAFLGLSYWSIVIGTICGNLSNAIILTAFSDWKPRFRMKIIELKAMLSFSLWSLLESLGTWLTSYIGTFIVGNILSQYYLGVYKTTITTVNGIFSLITTATTSVVFSSLSRLQNDREAYDKAYIEYIKYISVAIIPMGIGIYFYKQLFTDILLGSQWGDAVEFAGIYGLMCCFTIVYGQFTSEYFRGLGKPKANVLTTVLHLAALIPVLIITSRQGFDALIYGRSLVKIEQIIAFWVVLWIGFHFNPFRLLYATRKSVFSSLFMGVFCYLFTSITDNIILQFLSILVCILMYLFAYIVIFRGKNDFSFVVDMMKSRKKK